MMFLDVVKEAIAKSVRKTDLVSCKCAYCGYREKQNIVLVMVRTTDNRKASSMMWKILAELGNDGIDANGCVKSFCDLSGESYDELDKSVRDLQVICIYQY